MAHLNTAEVQDLFSEAFPDLLASQNPKPARTKELVKGLFDLYAKTGEKLESTSEENFAKFWVLRSLAHELLQYSIEDDYVDLNQNRKQIVKALKSLAERDHWFADQRLDKALSACRAVATQNPILDIPVEVTINRILKVIGRIAPAGKPPIQVSTKAYPFVPILEDSVTHPEYVAAVVTAYATRIASLQSTLGVNALCFVEKDVGPVGALSMMSMLVERLKLPATVYRMKHWAARAKIAAHKPTTQDRFAIIYDLVVTGDGIQQVANDIKDRYGAEVPTAVVLFGYESKRAHLPLKTAGSELQLEVLGWYDASLAEEVDKIRQGTIDTTPHIRRLELSPLRNPPDGMDFTKEDHDMLDHTPAMENLGVIVAGLEDFDQQELIALVPALYGADRPDFRGLSRRQLRKILIEQAYTIYHQQPQSLNKIKAAVSDVAVATFERLVK